MLPKDAWRDDLTEWSLCDTLLADFRRRIVPVAHHLSRICPMALISLGATRFSGSDADHQDRLGVSPTAVDVVVCPVKRCPDNGR